MYPPEVSGVIESRPMPSHVPPVPEVGATSAALKSAAFFIGTVCKPYNDDFMMCRKERWNTHGPGGCLKEGRKVTRCASYVINSLNKACGDAYRVHYECLDNHNQQYKDCRPAERGFNYCVMNRMGLIKRIPGAEGIPIWLNPDPYYGPKDQAQDIRGKEMEMKYLGVNLQRLDKSAVEKLQTQIAAAIKQEESNPTLTKDKNQSQDS